MKTVGWNELRRYGINPLTGEACPFGLRVLTDLTERGRRIVLDMLGTDFITLNRNWNSGSEFSVMIPRSLFQDVYVWCLISEGIDEIIVSEEGVCGRTAGDSDDDWEGYYKALQHFDKKPRRISPVGGPRRGTRMVHAMTDRSE
jgi:hypothetical protein